MHCLTPPSRTCALLFVGRLRLYLASRSTWLPLGPTGQFSAILTHFAIAQGSGYTSHTSRGTPVPASPDRFRRPSAPFTLPSRICSAIYQNAATTNLGLGEIG